MEFKGTKGEWVCVPGNVNQLTVVKIGKDHEFELEINGKNKIDKEIANAKLIASAPELLEALQSLMEVYNTKGQLLSFNVDIARKAIEKALL